MYAYIRIYVRTSYIIRTYVCNIYLFSVCVIDTSTDSDSTEL